MQMFESLKYPEVQLPEFPDYEVSITEFGAVEGGTVSNTEAFNGAISAVSRAGGGRVVVPAGIWLTGPITLLSNVNLYTEYGAVVLFTHDESEYPLIKTSYEGEDRIRALSPIHAKGAENIALTGNGIFDGNGQLWRMYKRSKLTNVQWAQLLRRGGVTKGEGEREVWFPSQSSYDGHMNKDIKPDEDNALERAKPYFDYYRPVMVSLISCKKVLIDGVTLQNSPAWNVHPLFCEHFTLQNATIRNPWNAQNGDGLDLESCKYANIFNTRFDVGDDAICMKSGKNAAARKIAVPTEYVTIRDCIVYHGHGGFVVGSEMSRGMRNIRVENCTFMGTDIGIRFKSTLGRGGVVQDIVLDGIKMVDIPKQAILFTMAYSGALDEQLIEPEDIPEFKNIVIKNTTCQGCGQAIQVDGLSQLPIHDLYFRDSFFAARNGVRLERASDIHFERVTVEREGNASERVTLDQTQQDGFKCMMWE